MRTRIVDQSQEFLGLARLLSIGTTAGLGRIAASGSVGAALLRHVAAAFFLLTALAALLAATEPGFGCAARTGRTATSQLGRAAIFGRLVLRGHAGQEQSQAEKRTNNEFGKHESILQGNEACHGITALDTSTAVRPTGLVTSRIQRRGRAQSAPPYAMENSQRRAIGFDDGRRMSVGNRQTSRGRQVAGQRDRAGPELIRWFNRGARRHGRSHAAASRIRSNRGALRIGRTLARWLMAATRCRLG